MTGPGGDQTRGDSTLFLDASAAVTLSRNEAASLGMKAARGAGMSWGLAEEAGFATAWLTERGIDGPKHLFDHLTAAQGREWADLCPTVAVGEWRAAPGRSLCPMALGATLCDYAKLPEGRVSAGTIMVGPVDHPLLLIPFLAAIAVEKQATLFLEWDDRIVAVGGRDAWLVEALVALGGHRRLSFELSSRPEPQGEQHLARAPSIETATIAGLTELAMRTTVPASAASRAGAGASTTDND